MAGSAEELRREMRGDGGNNADYDPAKRKPRKKPKDSRQKGSEPKTQKHPTAPAEASAVAQDWVDRGNALGFEFPFDVNYLALAIHRRIGSEPEFKGYPEDQVHRWLLKMSERWWEEYVTGEITRRNAKEYFLDADWDDLREYARTCLRAAYLKVHGVPAARPEYPNQRAYQETLGEIRNRSRVEELVSNALEVDEVVRPELDETRRERLRSWRSKRGDHN